MHLINGFNDEEFRPLYLFLKKKGLKGIDLYLIAPELLSYLRYLDTDRNKYLRSFGHYVWS